MTYLAHSAHPQFGALWLACLGWVLTAVALGLVQWRVWLVSERRVITSGVAWVGLWRTCFHSHTAVSAGFRVTYCRSMGPAETFTPPEVAAAQALMLLSLLVGLAGNAGGVYAMRNAYFGVAKTSGVRRGFVATGALHLLAAVMSLVPLLWNLVSVVTNQTISFPPDFKLPSAPESQQVGGGIWVGMAGAALVAISGIIFCSYRLPSRPRARTQPSPEHLHQDCRGSAAASGGDLNPAFELEDHL